MNENIRVGTRGTVKVGRNEVKVKVVGKAPNGGWKVKTESGKEMTVKNITTEAKAEAPAEKRPRRSASPPRPQGSASSVSSTRPPPSSNARTSR